MIGARAKYQNEQDPRYGGQLMWPGNQYGVPFRGDGNGAPLLKQREYESLEVVGDFHVALFNLLDPEQLAGYIWVRDRCANNLFRLLYVDRFFEPPDKMLVIVEWLQMVSQLPPAGVRIPYIDS